MAKKQPARRDFEKLEQRRIQGAKLLRQGLTQAEVARRLAVSRESVRRWWNQMQAQGSPEALKKAPRGEFSRPDLQNPGSQAGRGRSIESRT
jgi:transposase